MKNTFNYLSKYNFIISKLFLPMKASIRLKFVDWSYVTFYRQFLLYFFLKYREVEKTRSEKHVV